MTSLCGSSLNCLAFEQMLLAEEIPQTFLIVTKSYSIGKRKNFRQKYMFYSFLYVHSVYMVPGPKRQSQVIHS